MLLVVSAASNARITLPLNTQFTRWRGQTLRESVLGTGPEVLSPLPGAKFVPRRWCVVAHRVWRKDILMAFTTASNTPDATFDATRTLATVSFILCIVLLLIWLILPAERTRRSPLAMCLVASFSVLSVSFRPAACITQVHHSQLSLASLYHSLSDPSIMC